MTDRRRWIAWLGLLVLVTAVLRAFRGQVEQVHVTLLYLLLVLGASANGGRRIGLTVATITIASIDFFFQAPYDTIVVHENLDWLVLITFYITAIVATSLLDRAKREAATASQRTIEARQLAHIGAQTMRHGSPSVALHAIASLVLERCDGGRCSIRPFRDGALGDETYEALRKTGIALMLDPVLLERCATTGAVTLVTMTDELRESAIGDLEAVPNAMLAGVRTLVLPLALEQQTVGVLALTDDVPLNLNGAERRFLAALAYYAAVALEWEQLSAEAAHASAAAEASRMKALMLVSLSHDLRTPLTTIKALAQSASLNGSQSGRAIEEQVDRLSRLVSDVLELSRLEGADTPMDISVNTAEDLVGALVRQTRGILDGTPLDVHVDMEPDALAGRFDFVGTLRILSNLVENAARYTPPGQHVTIEAEPEGEWLVFSVADRGPGIPEGQREAIFEPFYRPQTAPIDSGRVGLGLAIARRLAAAQHGRLDVSGRDGGGSVFSLRLPRAFLTAEPSHALCPL